MKKIITIFLVVFLTGWTIANAQTTYEWQKPPKSTEIEIGVITNMVTGDSFDIRPDGSESNHPKEISDESLYESLLEKAREKYGEPYPNFALRSFKSKKNDLLFYACSYFKSYKREYDCSATVVIPDPKALANENLSKAIDKALGRVREGSRLAIDNVSVSSEINKEDYKDQVIDVLLDKGYKVVAKEYLEKLMKEQEAQRSGIYNDNTTVTDNNFTAVGYYINVKVTESSLRVQVVNVSTGEYEGNATINF